MFLIANFKEDRYNSGIHFLQVGISSLVSNASMYRKISRTGQKKWSDNIGSTIQNGKFNSIKLIEIICFP